jgi:7-cyano-7-deazaguanine synthase
MTSEQPAAVVLLSGGMDSTVLLHRLARARGGPALIALSFDYGQRHARELACAREQARRVGVAAHHVIDLAFLGALLRRGSALVEGGGEVPDLEALRAADRDQPPTYVPHRNLMLLSMAAACAEAHGIVEVHYGAQAQDEYGYWDCTEEFIARLNATLALNRRTPVRIHAPLVRRSKADNVREGLALGVDFAQTWSCYRGAARPCATCPTCVERARAFAQAGVNDPLMD